MSESYTLTKADADGCREILAELEEIEAKLGTFHVGSVQGHTKSATATVHYERSADPLTTSEAITRAVNALPMVALLAKKIVAHYEAHNGASQGGDR